MGEGAAGRGPDPADGGPGLQRTEYREVAQSAGRRRTPAVVRESEGALDGFELSRALSLFLKKDQTHQPGRHRPGTAAGFAPHHHTTVIVETQSGHGHRRIILFIRATT